MAQPFQPSWAQQPQANNTNPNKIPKRYLQPAVQIIASLMQTFTIKPLKRRKEENIYGADTSTLIRMFDAVPFGRGWLGNSMARGEFECCESLTPSAAGVR